MELSFPFRCGVVFWMTIFTSTARAEPPGLISAPVFKGQIATDGDLLVVPVFRHKKRYNFVLDTGASHSVIDSNSFRDLIAGDRGPPVTETGNAGIKARSIQNPNDFLIGGCLPLATSHLRALSLARISGVHGAKLDGIVGCDFLNRHRIRLDFDKGYVRIAERLELPQCPSYELVRDEFARPSMFLPLFSPIKRREDHHSFLIDTGAFGSHSLCLNPELCESAIASGALSIDAWTRGVDITGATHPRIGTLRGALIWSGKPEQLRVLENVAGRTNLLALPFLLRHNLTIDFPNLRLYVEPRSSSPVSCDFKDKSGVVLLRYDQEIVVDEVRPQSPAAKADIRKDDIIVSVNSVPSKEYRLTPIRIMLCEEGKVVCLRIRRDSREWNVDLELVDYRKPATRADFE